MDDQKLPSETAVVTNIVLVGRTGNGKSATGNTLLGQNVFAFKNQAKSVTKTCEMHRAEIPDGPIINMIDTPGLYNLAESAENISKEITRCLSMAEEGIHAVLLVLSVKNRITQEELATLSSLQSIFERKIVDYVIVVFTGGDELAEEEMTLDDYLDQGCPEFLKEVLKLCGGRKILLDNMTTNKDKKAMQLKELLTHVTDVARQTGGHPYTDDMHRTIKEEHDKQREKQRLIEAENHSAEKLAVLKQDSQIQYEEKMKVMSREVAQKLKERSKTDMRRLKDKRSGNAGCKIV